MDNDVEMEVVIHTLNILSPMKNKIESWDTALLFTIHSLLKESFLSKTNENTTNQLMKVII
jgi:hypothetical protein